MLSQADVAPYLLARGLVSPQSIVDGDFVVTDASSRNRNFKVECRTGPSYLLKQGLSQEGVATVANEASVYSRLSQMEGLKPYLPQFCGYDGAQRTLIIELVREGRDMRTYHLTSGRFSTTLASELGCALGRLHKSTHLSGVPGHQTQPWVLTVHRPDLDIFREASGASLELIKIIQQAPGFGQRLDELAKSWQPSVLAHRDLKWDNIVVYAASSSNRTTRLKLIDWEAAAAGDPCWDVGSAFSNYLSFWIFSIPITGQTPPESFPSLARYPLSRMRPALGKFWQAYGSERGLEAADSRACLMRSVVYAGARLIQTAFESTQTAQQLTSAVVLHLQLALNILQRPQEAAVHLFGLPSWYVPPK